MSLRLSLRLLTTLTLLAAALSCPARADGVDAEPAKAAASLVYAGKLIGAEVALPGDGESRVVDLLVDGRTGRVVFVALAHPDVDGHVAGAPLSALQVEVGTDGAPTRVALAIPRERLTAAPRFAQDGWDTAIGRGFAARVLRYHGAPAMKGDGFGALRRASRLRALPLSDGERRVGALRDLLLDPTTAQIALAVADESETGARVAIPWALIEPGIDDVRVALSAARLGQAPVLTGDDWLDPRWRARAARFYATDGDPAPATYLIRASHLLASELRDRSNQYLGAVDAIAFDRSTGSLLYVVVDIGVYMQGKRVAVPLAPLRRGDLRLDRRALLCDLTRAQLEAAPAMAGADWRVAHDAAWHRARAAAFGADDQTTKSQKSQKKAPQKTAPGEVHDLAGLIDLNVLVGLELIGELDEVVLDWSGGRVAYAVLGYGGIAGIGERYYAVPYHSLVLAPARRCATLNPDVANQKLRTSPPLRLEAWDRWPRRVFGQAYLDAVHRHYGTQAELDRARR